MPAPILPREWRRILALTALILLAASLPYWLAYAVPAGHVFAGILFNPQDGQSYLAKMQEGWRGAWLFTLPYTAQPGQGVFVYFYYLGLGHLARWLGLSLELVYHAARVVAGAFLLLTAYHFVAQFFRTARARLGVWFLFALGSGLGWLAAPLGGFTSDLWVAEAFPFLSVFSNSHFCLAAALMLWILEWTLVKNNESTEKEQGQRAKVEGRRLVGTALAVTALALLQPMALLVLGVLLGVLTTLEAARELRRRQWPLLRLLIWPGWRPLVVAGVCAAPWLIYDVLITLTQPQISGWNAQNVTPSPPLWDAALSGGAPLALALVGGVDAVRRRRPQALVPLAWLVLNGLLLYAPLALQRRLSLGIWMPVVILAGFGWQGIIWPRLAKTWRILAVAGMALVVAPSNLLVYAASLSAVPKQPPQIFLTQGEAAALDWLAQNASDKVVLASPDTGLFIPTRTGARVIYGHPIETVVAAAHKQAVEDFFAGRVSPEAFFAQYPVDFVFYGPRERQFGAPPALSGWQVVFSAAEVTIYGK